jgi:tetratricopeptide (TPR) repeat protein
MAAVLAFAVAVPSWAGDSAAGQAKNELKWGLNAAKRGYWLEALNRFQKANQLVPDRPHVLNNIAVALEASGRFEDALLTYETALSIAPSDQVVRRNYAQFKEFYDTYIAPIATTSEEDTEAAPDESTEGPPDEGRTGDAAADGAEEAPADDTSEGS